MKKWYDEHYVSACGKEEMNKLITFLEAKGFKNVQNLTAENYTFPVIFVKYNYFHGLNTMCMAIVSSKGVQTIKLEEFKGLFGE